MKNISVAFILRLKLLSVWDGIGVLYNNPYLGFG